MSPRHVSRCAVIGIGADGWNGLSGPARHALTSADAIAGSDRQLALLDGAVTAERVRWPSPLLPALPAILRRHTDHRLAVLASGDPMFFGIGTAIVRLLGPENVEVLPQASSVSLACARLGWSFADVDVVSAVGRPLSAISPSVQPGQKVAVLVGNSHAAADVANLMREMEYTGSRITVLEQLGSPSERVTRTDARADPQPHDPLAIVAVECSADPGLRPLPRTPGLPDDAFHHDGQITKREVRATTIAMLGAVPGQLLWDVGAGSGSVAIEWMRTHPSCRAVAVEARKDRVQRITCNAETFGVPDLRVIEGRAPESLAGLDEPDAVFVGGGVSAPGVLDTCVAVLREGGRLVANAVTVETESVLATWYGRLGGELRRMAIQRASPVGRFTGWRAAMPVTQWSYRKGHR